MSSGVRCANEMLAGLSARVGYALWRETLKNNYAFYAEKAASADTVVNLVSACALRDGFAGAVWVRDLLSKGSHLDRVTGTGWDNARPPGNAQPTARPEVADIDRLDLGSLHKKLARQLGGTDAAVLSCHLGFFAVRMGRHAFIGAVTAGGFVPCGLFGLARGLCGG